MLNFLNFELLLFQANIFFCQSVFLRLLFLTLVLQVAIIVCLRLFYTESDRIVVSLIQNDSFGRYILPVIKQVPRADLAWAEPVWSINWQSLKRCLLWNKLVTDGLLWEEMLCNLGGILLTGLLFTHSFR